MRVFIIVTGLAIGFALTWWASDMLQATRETAHTSPQSASMQQPMPRLLQPGLGFAFLAPR